MFFSRAIRLALALLVSGACGVAQGAGWSVALGAPDRIDRQAGPGDVGEEIVLTATVDNQDAVDRQISQAAVKFTVSPTNASVDGQYVVTQPAFPSTVTAQTRQGLAFRVRPWATATSEGTVTVRVTLFTHDVATGSVETRTATTAWQVRDGPDLLLGQTSRETFLGGEKGLSGPRHVFSDGARLIVADRVNNRVLIYKPVPTTNNQPSPAVVIGQPDFAVSELNNGAGPRALYLPSAACTDGRRLFVADTENSRVLIWDPIPTTNFAPATLVLGQPDFVSGTDNHGGRSASSLLKPRFVCTDGTRLFVADTFNHRILIWNRIPTTNQTPADVVLGQPTFSSGTLNIGGIRSGATLSQPWSVQTDGTRLVVCDRSNSRVLIWNTIPTANFTPANVVVGQLNATTFATGLGAQRFDDPVAAHSDGLRLFVVDQNNNRVLMFGPIPTADNAAASLVIGPSDFEFSTTYSPGAVDPRHLRSPSGVFSDGERVFVVDENRILQFGTIPSLNQPVATQVTGQPGFTVPGSANNPGLPSSLQRRQILSPVQISAAQGRLAVADFAGRVAVFNTQPGVDNVAADAAVGQPDFATLGYSGLPTSTSSNQPTGVMLFGSKLLYSDFYENRIMVFNSIPATGGGASVAIGQPDFSSFSQNAGSSGLSAPRGLAPDGSGFWVADSGNHRVLRYSAVPTAFGAVATRVLGQADFSGNSSNRGGSAAANTLDRPRSVAAGGGKLFVADTDNHRVLCWDPVPSVNGISATFCLGQANFTGVLQNGGVAGSASTLFVPVSVTTDGERLAVADSLNDRVLLWNRLPTSFAQPADVVFGRPDFTTVLPRPYLVKLDGYLLSQPQSVLLTANSLWIGDTLNSRVLRFDLKPVTRVRVDAGKDRAVSRGAVVQLAGTASGTGTAPFSYSWVQESGPLIPIVNSNTSTARFTPTTGGMYGFRLTATDAALVQGVGKVHVLVNSAPVVPTQNNRILNPQTVVLDASATRDPDGDVLTFLWQGTGGSAGLPISGAGTRLASFQPTPGTTYSLQLLVFDGFGEKVIQTFQVTVRRNPIAVASRPGILGANQIARLDGSLSLDPTGLTLTYLWQQTSGPAVTLAPSTTSPTVTFATPIVDAQIGFALTVENTVGGTATAITTVVVDGTQPTATLQFPNGVVATSRGAYLLQVDFSEPMSISPTPVATFVRIVGTGQVPGGPLRPRLDDTDRTRFEISLDATFARTGTYTIVLTASDSHGNGLLRQPAGNSFAIAVPNRTPVAVAAGPSQATTGSTVIVDGNASSDADLEPLAYAWTGRNPAGGSVTFTRPTSSKPSFVPVLPGNYVITLIVTDPNGVASLPSAPLTIRADAPSALNRPPVATAGADQFVGVGGQVTLRGTASDLDGDPLGYSWTLVSRPPGSALPLGQLPDAKGGRSLEAFFTPDVPGSYPFLFRVTDRFGVVAASSVTIRVDDHANSPQTAGAADALGSASTARDATLEATGDVDIFTLPSATGTLYRVRLQALTVPAVEVSLLDLDGFTLLSRATATPAADGTLTPFRPPVSGIRYLRVSAPGAAAGAYRIVLDASPDSFPLPPALTLSTRRAEGQIEASIATSGTSAPLAFLQFLTDYDASNLTLVARTPEAAATGFAVEAQQFSLPFIDTLFSAQVQPRPVMAGPLVSFGFRPAPGNAATAPEVGILSVSATPPPPLKRVTTFRPTADAGVSLTLKLANGMLPDPLDPARRPARFLRLDGRGSRDPNLPPLPLSYRWRIVEAPGPSAAISAPATPSPTVALAGPGRYRFGLNVSNGVLESPTSTVDFAILGTARPPAGLVLISTLGGGTAPTDAKAGVFDANAGDTLVLDGSRSTDEDAGDVATLRFAWRQLAGPVTVVVPERPVFSFPAVVEGKYRFELVVLDSSGLSSPAEEAAILVHAASNAPPILSLTALGSSTSVVGGDLGPVPETAVGGALRVPIGTEVTVQARVSDPDFDRASQQGLFFWKQVRGPVVQLSQLDSPPARSRVNFAPKAVGVYELECRVKEASPTGSEIGPEATRRIRVLVDSATRRLPTASARARLPGGAKTLAPPRASDGPGVVVQTRTPVLLDGTASLPGTAEAPAYRWIQIQGPVVALSDPFAAVTTFVAPAFADGEPRRYAFQLLVDDGAKGDLRSAPAPIVLDAVPDSRILVVVTQAIPPATVGVSYSATLVVTGGAAPFAFSVAAGSLPAGLSLDTGTGRLSGTPLTATTAAFTVAVADASAPTPQTARRALTLRVGDRAISSVAIETTTLPPAVVGRTYDLQLRASGGTPPYFIAASSGRLPIGLALDSATARISGTPLRYTTPADVTFSVADSSNPIARVGSRRFTLRLLLISELTAGAGLTLVALPIKPLAGPASAAALGRDLGASLVAWVERETGGRGRFRSLPPGAAAGSPPIAGATGLALFRGPGEPVRIEILGEPWPDSDYLLDLPAGLALIALPPGTEETRTTADLLALTGSRFVAVTGPASARSRLAPFTLFLPDSAPAGLAAGAGYLLSMPAAVRIDLKRWLRP